MNGIPFYSERFHPDCLISLKIELMTDEISLVGKPCKTNESRCSESMAVLFTEPPESSRFFRLTYADNRNLLTDQNHRIAQYHRHDITQGWGSDVKSTQERLQK